MLRPACWLPPKRLLTPRLGRTTLIARLGSATRRSGTYRGGTCTRWSRTTGCDRSKVRIITTHHRSILARSRSAPQNAHEFRIRHAQDRRMLCRFAGLQSLSLASRHLLPKERRISLFKARTTAVACGDSAVKSERSDEMLTGQRAFDGPTSADVLAAVLRARARFAASRDAR
jgi:hypothetical protein